AARVLAEWAGERRPDVDPRSSAVERLQDAGAVIAVAREVGLAGAGIDGRGALRVERERADCERRLIVGQRLPGGASVGGAPDVALRGPQESDRRGGGVDYKRRHETGGDRRAGLSEV